ncbi:YqbH/XkdH family protein [Bacillus subtilis]|uniref:Uncharacterized protein YqbH n=3 Tax=Bacillus subtilis subsp. subtilis TaxID=135461 RepID=YQBH_BACSU|nr:MULTISPECIES: YqbH/XkdH family protein [Bacillales]NP_390488.1 conserved phage protein of unknown function; skin element [Bacillus subtilis subsp. subtilis str. 168]P45924.1 RecName: Full=Uncharacterized protein YqbH [Bacillus subtilis subsp. subtilis str. 168]MBW4823840.1 YqbH/XkdH family protein [Bacillaceae bacterium]AGG62011.1 skin element YqbH [Bacillus subtilis subsp. subtilis 6051-HGW]AHA78496.1 Uncharacterized protein yqbH [Bacillus subtilis PY79]AIC41066.1 hypothetical protein BSU
MSYQSLLTHRCDIYHLQEKKENRKQKFGVPVEDVQPVFSYPDEPDIENQPCYFTEKSQSIIQQESNVSIYQSFLVHFPATADIRVNDRAVWDGTAYKLQKPRKIRNHHWEVTAVREVEYL